MISNEDNNKMIYARKICEVCGSEYDVTQKSRISSSKYCSMVCVGKTQKGKKNPHSKDWEEKRLSAVRKAIKEKVFPKGYKRPIEHTIGMINGHKKFRENNPKRHREIAIRNLSKSKTLNLIGRDNPQWKGGITKEATKQRNKYSARIEKFREIVLKRDNYSCKQCGSTSNLEVHHIISFKELPEASYLPINGVTLCKNCHKKTDTFGAKGINSEKIYSGVGNVICVGMSIPHHFQAYSTVGNYAWTDTGILIIFVSELKDEKYESLIFLHEYIEAILTKWAGISEEQITNFDLDFENNRKEGNVDEPGFDSKAPYLKQHSFATGVELGMCAMAGIDWKQYDEKVNSL